LAARRAELLKALAVECGPNALAVPTDVGESDQVQHLAQATIDRFGKIDCWVNNAGVIAGGRFDSIPVASQQRMIKIDSEG
ncbi:SDR family oxidoreductase, partial [Vibrio parahaemolyticus]